MESYCEAKNSCSKSCCVAKSSYLKSYCVVKNSCSKSYCAAKSFENYWGDRHQIRHLHPGDVLAHY